MAFNFPILLEQAVDAPASQKQAVFSMAHVQFTPALRRFAPALAPFEAEVATVAELLVQVEVRFPGLRAYLVDERGALRPHVNVFIGEDLIRDKQGLSDPLKASDEVYILQSLSGG